MTETGILEYFERRYPAVNDTCSRIKEDMAKARALTLQEAGAAFLVLGAGISMAMTVLGCFSGVRSWNIHGHDSTVS